MTVLANDLFTDTNGVELSAHVPTTGSSWIATHSDGADLVIATNRARGSVGGYAPRQARLDKGTTYPNDYSVIADFVFKTATTDDYIWIGARSALTGRAGYYFGYETASAARRFRLYKHNGISTLTVLGTYAYAFPAADTVEQVELIVSGTTIKGKVGGVEVISVTDSDHTAGYPSIYFNGSGAPSDSTSVHIDSFSATADNTADISAFVVSQVPGTASGYRLTGEALVSPTISDSVPIPFTTDEIAWTATAAQVNQAILDAAIAAVAVQGYVVGVGDNQIVISGAA